MKFELCDYGCGQPSTYRFLNGKNCCKKNVACCPGVINKRKNNNSYSMSEKSKKIMVKNWQKTKRKYQDTLPFVEKMLVEQTRIILEEQEGKCLICGIKDWLGDPIKLHLDHIDGNNQNQERENLRYICPNCHSQTETYCGKNKNKGRLKVSDDELIEAIKTTPNTRQALLKVGLVAKGLNYTRVENLSKQL